MHNKPANITRRSPACALGADRDGANIPNWLASCSAQPYLFSRFEDKFGAEIARKLFFENTMRFFGAA